MKLITNAIKFFSTTFLALGLIGCATQEHQPAPVAPNSATVKTTVQPAPGSPFSKIKLGMSKRQVEQLIGFPDRTSSHITGKQFIPFYFGGDTRRSEAYYKGQGVLTYDNNSRFGPTNTLVKITVDTHTP